MIAECRLDLAGLRTQRDRYRALGEHVDRVERTGESVVVDFAASVDPTLINEALVVERECCPFFGLAYDESSRRLTVTVASREQLPALDAIAFALRPPRLGAGAGI